MGSRATNTVLVMMSKQPPDRREENRMVEATMAKKRTEPTPEPEEELRDELIAVRCTGRYKKWTKEFAREQLVTPSQLVAIALKFLAENRNFKLPPDR